MYLQLYTCKFFDKIQVKNSPKKKETLKIV